MRKTKFETDNYYHIYNRGVDKREIFADDKDFIRFIQSMREFNRPEPIGSLYELNQRKKVNSAQPLRAPSRLLEAPGSLVEIICYALIPNHFHLLVKQLAENGISKFMHKVGMGYTNYFNLKYHRNGSLFQGPFKSIPILTEEKLLQLSCYINGNPEIHRISKAEEWPWSSYQDYLNLRNGTLCAKNIILEDFKTIQEYKELTNTEIKESQEIKAEEKKYFLE